MNVDRQPFQEAVDTALFFGGGARREIVDDIKAALLAEVPLITLTGTDGSGKTMICRIVEQELQDEAEILFFDQGVESFDELINRITTYIGFSGSTEVTDRKARLEKAFDLLNQQNRRLVLMIDGADRIFPATLERIRRMLDQINIKRIAVQLLFSGRPLFSINYRQLAIITFKGAEEKHFSLDPLDGKAIHQYLTHCLEILGVDEERHFSPQQAERIADIARGNFLLINRLGAEYLESTEQGGDAAEGEDAPEDDTEASQLEEEADLSAGMTNVDLDFLKVPRLRPRWYAAGIIVIGLILLLVILKNGNDDPAEEVPSDSADVPELTLEKVEPDPIDIPTPVAPVEPLTPPERRDVEVPEPPQVAGSDREAATPLAQEALTEAVPTPQERQSGLSEPEEDQALQEATAEARLRSEAAEEETAEIEQEQAAVRIETEVEAIEDSLPKESLEAVTDAARVRSEAAQAETTALETTQGVASEGDERSTEPAEEAQPPAGGTTVTESVASGTEAPQSLVPEETAQVSLQTEQAPPATTETATAVSTVEQTRVAAETALREEEELLAEISVNTPPEPVAAQPESQQVSARADQRTQDAEPGSGEATGAGVEASGAESGVIAPAESEVEDVPGRPASPEAFQIPQLTVVTKKKSNPETVPTTVVTLKDERKVRPDQISEQQAPEAADSQPPSTQPEDTGEPPAAVDQRPAVIAEPSAEPSSAAVTEPVQVASVPALSPEQNSPSQPRVAPELPPKQPEVYYAERLAAGSRWLVGGSRDKYTVRLMVLDSGNAQQNVRDMLAEEGYRPIMDQLYILKQSGQPQTVMIYWGEFDSQSEARQAKNQLPEFLDKLQPSELPIKEAVAKARGSQ